MKNIKSLSVLFLAFMLIFVSISNRIAGETTPQKEIIIEYTTFNNQPVQIVCDKLSRIIIRVRLPNDETMGLDGEYLEFLKKEVLKIAQPGKKTPLNNGYTFIYTGGCPIWGPHTLFAGKDGHFSGLMFAENATISEDGKQIIASGTEKPPTYNGYELWEWEKK